MVFEAIRQQLSPLDFSTPNPASEEELEYFRFYGIDCEQRVASVEHFVGSLSLPDSLTGADLMCHWYRRHGSTACCFIVHGYYDHTGLYGHLIEYFLKANRDVVMIDLPGHGLSSGPRASIGAFSEYVEALKFCVESSNANEPLPAEFVGQSTGAAIVMQYLLDAKINNADDAPAKVALLAPLVRPYRWPLMRHVFAMSRLFLRSTPRRFSTNSHDQNFLCFVNSEDPLQHRRLPMQWVLAMRNWLAEFLQAKPIMFVRPLIIQGKQDRTVDWRFNVAEICKKFPCAEVAFLEDAKHHLVNESGPIRQKLFAELDRYFLAPDGADYVHREVAA